MCTLKNYQGISVQCMAFCVVFVYINTYTFELPSISVHCVCVVFVPQAKEQCNGLELDGRRIRVDYSITKRAHTPTPGVYMGKPTRSYDDRGHGSNRSYDDRDDYYDRGVCVRERERERERD